MTGLGWPRLRFLRNQNKESTSSKKPMNNAASQHKNQLNFVTTSSIARTRRSEWVRMPNQATNGPLNGDGNWSNVGWTIQMWLNTETKCTHTAIKTKEKHREWKKNVQQISWSVQMNWISLFSLNSRGFVALKLLLIERGTPCYLPHRVRTKLYMEIMKFYPRTFIPSILPLSRPLSPYVCVCVSISVSSFCRLGITVLNDGIW